MNKLAFVIMGAALLASSTTMAATCKLTIPFDTTKASGPAWGDGHNYNIVVKKKDAKDSGYSKYLKDHHVGPTSSQIVDLVINDSECTPTTYYELTAQSRNGVFNTLCISNLPGYKDGDYTAKTEPLKDSHWTSTETFWFNYQGSVPTCRSPQIGQ